MSTVSIKAADAGMIRCNADGSPWTVVRTVKGQPVVMTAIRNGNKWIETPAQAVIDMVNKVTAEPATDAPTERQRNLAKELRNLTMSYWTGGTQA